MTADTVSKDVARRRLFYSQLGLVGVTLGLIMLGRYLEAQASEKSDAGSILPQIGSFWFAFLAGAIGSSIAMTSRMKRSAALVDEVARTWFSIAQPLMYGSLMASTAYMIFMSGVISGDGGEGFLTSNLFPNFSSPEEGVVPTISTFLDMRPETLKDVGKLMIWCFISGYSERFVVGLITQMEAGRSPAAKKS